MARPKKPTIEIVLQLGKPIFAFPVLNQGKSKDTSGAIYEMPDGKRYIVLTNHGQLYVGRPGELVEKLLQYEQAQDFSEHALRVFYKEDSPQTAH